MRQVKDEEILTVVQAERKGQPRNPCEIAICITDECEIILRTEDCKGIAPIVAVLSADAAAETIRGLERAVSQSLHN